MRAGRFAAGFSGKKLAILFNINALEAKRFARETPARGGYRLEGQGG